MQSNLEQIKEMVRSLPIEDLDELEATISEEKKAKEAKTAMRKNETGTLSVIKNARKWLDETAKNI